MSGFLRGALAGCFVCTVIVLLHQGRLIEALDRILQHWRTFAAICVAAVFCAAAWIGWESRCIEGCKPRGVQRIETGLCECAAAPAAPDGGAP